MANRAMQIGSHAPAWGCNRCSNLGHLRRTATPAMPLLDNIKDVLKDRPKSGAAVLPKLLAQLQVLDTDKDKERAVEKALEGIAKYLAQFKTFLFGTEDSEVSKESVLALANECVKTDVLLLLLRHLTILDFESRKDASQVFSAVVRIRDAAGQAPGAAYVRAHADMLELLLSG